MSLCHRFHGREKRTHKVTTASLRASLEDIEQARRLEKVLRQLQHPNPSNALETGDSFTPLSHLLDIAEAYRLSALLQLYQAFQDPTSNVLQSGSPRLTTTPSSCDSLLSSLACRILRILTRIPLDSGSRSISPILYISASTGLKFDNLNPANTHDSIRVQSEEDALRFDSLGFDSSLPNPLTRTSLEVAQARQLVLERLGQLEHSLPSRPIVVARDLVKAIWPSYDCYPGRSHWIDVMQETGSYTVFG